MKHLLLYADFKFKKGWELINHDKGVLVRRGQGLIQSGIMKRNSGTVEVSGHIPEIRFSWFHYHIEKIPFSLSQIGYAGDAFKFTLPEQYYDHSCYMIRYDGKVHNGIIVSDTEYRDLKKHGILGSNYLV